MKKIVICILIALICTVVAYAAEDMEYYYLQTADRVSDVAADCGFIIEPDKEWNLNEREKYIYQIGIMEGFEWGYERGYEDGLEEFDEEDYGEGYDVGYHEGYSHALSEYGIDY